jgi:hypothetical protein
MSRDSILAIRLTDDERQAAERLAAVEKLPLSSLVRRTLLLQVQAGEIYLPNHPSLRSGISRANVGANAGN